MIERLVGCMTFARAMRLIGDWSTLEGVDAELLRRALRDVRDVQQMTVPTSDTIKAEYVGYRKMLRDPALFDDFFEEKRFIPPSFYLTWAWPMGEPQTTFRVSKIVCANWLSQCDLPREERTPAVSAKGLLFSPDPTVGPRSPEATSEQLEDWIRRDLIGKTTMAYGAEILDAADSDAARSRILETALVLQLFYHETGHYPETLDQILGHECDTLPIDPFANGKPLRYRRNPDAGDGITLWSIGPDGINHEGEPISERDGQKIGDIALNILPPRRRTEPSPSPETK